MRRYYDPGATPIPATPMPAGKTTTVAFFSRQVIRSIRRELTDHSFARARTTARRLGWPVETPVGRVPVSEENWRKIWLAQLEHAIAESKKQRGADA